MSRLTYLWVLRKTQVQDTVFMNEFAQFLQKHSQKFSNLILYSATQKDADTPEEIYFQAKRVSGFMSENLVPNSVFHLHQWGLVQYQDNNYVLNTEKLSKIFNLSSTIVLTNVWKETLLNLSDCLPAIQKAIVNKGFVFAKNPHLNIHTQDYTQANSYPEEQETAQFLLQMTPFFETWISHLNNLPKII